MKCLPLVVLSSVLMLTACVNQQTANTASVKDPKLTKDVAPEVVVSTDPAAQINFDDQNDKGDIRFAVLKAPYNQETGDQAIPVLIVPRTPSGVQHIINMMSQQDRTRFPPKAVQRLSKAKQPFSVFSDNFNPQAAANLVAYALENCPPDSNATIYLQKAVIPQLTELSEKCHVTVVMIEK